MPFFAPPRSDLPTHDDSPSQIPPQHRRRSGGAGGGGWARRFGVVAALAVALLAVVAGFALYAAGLGLPANPALHSLSDTHGVPAVSLAPHTSNGIGSAPVPASADAQNVCLTGNKDVFGSSLTVGADEWICGNVSVYGGSATILGHVNGNVTVVAGSADVSGRVDGNLTTIGGGIELHPGATVGGNVDAIGGGITRGAGVTIGGNVEQGLAGRDSVPAHWLGMFNGAAFPWFHILFWALAGLCVAAFFPGPLRRVRDVMRREPAISFFGGLAALFFGVVAALVLFITCLGIPIALLLVLGLWLAWIVGTVALGFWLGEGLLRLGAAHDRSPVVATVLGVTLLSLFESIPCFGGVVSFVAGFMGLGASTLAVLYSRRAAGWRAHSRVA